MNELLRGEEVLRLWDHRHGELMLQRTLLQHVEGCLADEDRLSVLDGLHRAYTKTAAISCAFHLVEDRNLRIAWGEKKNPANLDNQQLPLTAPGQLNSSS